MPPEDLERKLTAILSADVAGYSRLMSEDDAATVSTLTGYRETMASLIKDHRGRVVDSPGDNLLAEFSSVIHAVNCAVEIQRELTERNAELLEARRLEYRIGVNLGDVIQEGERIYGDGVNIAARLESLAEPGGVCISGSVYNQVKSRLNLNYEDLGEKTVKNIKEAVSVYRVLIEPESATDISPDKESTRRDSRKALPDGLKEFELPEGPSIAVLPFVNMSDDPRQEYFSDGLTENIITGLSCDGRLLVIARNSTFSYKGRAVKVQEVARELGAQYVVEGSVQKTKDRVRITAQLIDAQTGHHVWSDRYDRDLEDIFALQDEITMRIMHSVGMKVLRGERYYYEAFLPPTGNLEVYMKVLKAGEHFHRMNKEDNSLARQELEEAISLDPGYSLPYSLLAWTYIVDLILRPSESDSISLTQASKNIDKAFELDNENLNAHLALSEVHMFQKEHEKAIEVAERAIGLNPSGADAYSQLGFVLVVSGEAEQGLKLLEKSIRLNPIPPTHYLNRLGFAYRFLERYEDAIEVHKKVLKRSPNSVFAHIWLTAAYRASGREEEARHQAGELLKLDPTFSVEQFMKVYPMRDPHEAERFIEDLLKAGLKWTQ